MLRLDISQRSVRIDVDIGEQRRATASVGGLPAPASASGGNRLSFWALWTAMTGRNRAREQATNAALDCCIRTSGGESLVAASRIKASLPMRHYHTPRHPIIQPLLAVVLRPSHPSSLPPSLPVPDQALTSYHTPRNPILLNPLLSTMSVNTVSLKPFQDQKPGT